MIRLLLATTILTVCGAAPTFAQNADLLKRIEQMEQEIQILKRQAEVEKEVATAEKAKQASVEYGKKGFVVTSPDKRSSLSLRGNTQIDGRFFLDDEADSDSNEFLARRLRPIISGTYDDFSFRIMPDFAGGNARLFDAHIDYAFAEPFALRFGKFKTPIGLERLQSQTDLIFVERGFVTNLAPSRDFGFMAYGTIDGGLLEYQAGVFNGNADLSSSDTDSDDGKDYVARLFTQPFQQSSVFALRGLGVGLAGSVGEREGSEADTILGDYRSPGQQRIFSYRTTGGAAFADGTHWRLYPQAYYYIGPFGAMVEYGISNQAVTRAGAQENLQHEAWQLYGSYILTGEDASFKGVRPDQPLDLDAGTWGAFELAARVGGIDFDKDAFPIFANPASSVSEAQGFGLGLNWYFNERVKWQLNYDFTEFEGGAAAGDRPDEQALFTRLQYQF
jgi:phosphate-selective porin OprO/OprP